VNLVVKGAEDCLYLNIYTPKVNSQLTFHVILIFCQDFAFGMFSFKTEIQ